MNNEEFKMEILKALNEMPENVLRDLLNYLQRMQKENKGEVKMSNHLRKILEEDQKLLTRLAQ
jgi:hypothetical protein